MSDDKNFVEREYFVDTEDSHDGDFIPSGADKSKLHRINTKTKKTASAPRKLRHDWSHKQIVHLIALVKQHRGLWDVGSAEYKVSRLKSWLDVVDALNVDGIDVNEAKLKWMNLRLSFKNNITKLRTKKSIKGANESVLITWKYFPLLKFLEASNVRQSTESVSTISLAKVTTDQTISNDSTLEQLLPPPSTARLRRKRCTSPASTPTPPSSPIPSTSSSTLTTKLTETQLLSGALSSLDRSDKHDIFGSFVASELRALPPHESDALRLDLMRTVISFLENRQPAVSQPIKSSPKY